MPSKRKEHPLTDASPAKRKANRDQGEVLEDAENSWERRAGMILEVSMRNFMCHQTFTFKPNQRLTFLSGENGSGKSAVLTALVFALGGNARTASRGSSNKEFIRSGQTSAMVEVKLLNIGEGAYKPEIYGEVIVVNRTVTQTSSTYKLKDCHGQIVVERKVREELERILLAFNIQVDNPIAVLNQDTAKTFLFKSDPDKLYQFFMKATQLDSCKADYNTANRDKVESENIIEEKKASLPTLKKEMVKWEKKYNWHINFNNKKTDLKNKKATLAWARVRDIEEQISIETSNIEEKKVKIVKCDEEVKKIVENEKARMKEKKNIEAEIQEMVSEYQNEEGKLIQLRTEVASKMEKLRGAKKVHQEVEGKTARLRSEEKALESEIEKLRRTGTQELEERHRHRMATIRKCEEKIDETNSSVRTTENHLAHLTTNYRESENRMMELRAEKEKEAGNTRKLKQNLENISGSGKDKLAAFANWMPRVVDEIKRSRKFQVTPIGPLGVHIKVKEGTVENVVRTIEHELTSKGLLTAFLVTCSDDQRELYNIFQKHGVRSKPSIFTCPFTSQRHNIENGRVYTDQFHVLIDSLEVDDVNVYNRIVDTAQLERILYISTETDAQAVLSREDMCPRHTVYACVANSFMYYPAPAYRSYHYDERTTGLLKPNMEEYIDRLRQDLSQQASKETSIENKIREANNEKMSHKAEIEANEVNMKNMKARVRSLTTQILGLKNEDEAERPPDISALEEDLDKTKKALEARNKELAEARKEEYKMREEHNEVKEAYDDFNQKMISLAERGEPLKSKLNKIESDLKGAKAHKEYYEGKKKGFTDDISSLEAVITEKDGTLQEYREKAKGWSEERIDSRKKVESLKKEIFLIEESLKQQEEQQDSRQFVTEKFQEYREAYGRADSQIKYMSSTVEFLDQVLQQRKLGFKEIRASTCKNINRNFTTLLCARKYIGFLVFDHKENTLVIKVNPNTQNEAAGLDVDRDIRSLSGGEKSYSSVSLVLALWNAMTPPFRVLDEFDVFMDSVNRKIAIDNIMNYARTDRKYQFVFLTPLGTANINTDQDVKIVKLSKAQDYLIFFNFERILGELKYNILFRASHSSSPGPVWTEGRKVLQEISPSTSAPLPTVGCSLTKLDPYDPMILSLVSSTPSVTCRASQLSLLYTRQDRLHLNTTATDMTRLTCSYSYIQQVDTDTYTYSQEMIISSSPVVLSSQFNSVWARCVRNSLYWLDRLPLPKLLLYWVGVEVYHNILIYVPRLDQPVHPRAKDQYSVVTFIIDAMSQQNLVRSLPLTKSLLDSWGGFLFSGHNKVLHNSYPNVMALLSGETGGVFPPDLPDRKGMYFLDTERQPLLQTMFKQKASYLTLHLEDLQVYGTLTRSRKMGLRTPPADIYYRAPFLAMLEEDMGWMRNRLVGKADCYACLQEQLVHVPELRVVEDFISMYSAVPTFAHIHLNEYTHNDLNMGKLYDSDLRQMLERLLSSGALKNTFFLLMGDHGFQRAEDPFVLTRQGAVENDLPAFYLLPPANFKVSHQQMYQNLRNNSEKLTSFFDINQMLRQILAMASNKTVEDLFRGFEGHGTSLLGEVGDRTCAEADIPEDYCRCTDGISRMSPVLAQRMVISIISDINNFLAEFRLCQELSLSDVKEASVKRTTNLYSVKVKFGVTNRGGIFEGTFSWSSGDLSGKVVRLDWYSSTSECVPESLSHIKPFCIC